MTDPNSPSTPAPAPAAPSPDRLLLVGMPAAGKTTLGRGLAVLFGLPFRDLDADIVARAGRSVADIFAQEGEAYFRQLEADTLRQVLQEHPRLVLATGGGTPCFHQNMALLNEAGLTLWLDVPVPELVARVQQAAATRPLLAALPDAAALHQRLSETLAQRTRFYELAALHCPGPGPTPEAVQQLVRRHLASA